MTCFYTFNCRGIANHLKLLGILKDLKRKNYNSDYVIALQETKIHVLSSKHKAILCNYRLNHLIQPCGQNNSGGLILLYPIGWTVQCFHQSDMVLALKEEKSGHIFCSIYLNPISKVNEVSSELGDLAEELSIQQDHVLILIGGDFNSRSSSESKNFDLRRSDVRIKRYSLICNVFESIGCFDLFKLRGKLDFTHFDKKSKTHSRLDYIFCNRIDEIANVNTLYAHYSDHRILNACFENENNTMNRNGQSYWKLHYNVVKTCNEHEKLQKSLLGLSEMTLNLPITSSYDKFKATMRDWLRFLCIKGNKHLNDLDKSSTECQTTLYNKQGDSESLSQSRENSLRTKFKSIRGFYLDLNHGDSGALKSLLSQLKNQKSIKELKLKNGQTSSEIDEILEEFSDFYSDLYTKTDKPSELTARDELLNVFKHKNRTKIRTISKLFDDKPITEGEVKQAIIKLNKNSAPGSDGLTSDLYKNHPDFFAVVLAELFNTMLEEHTAPKSFLISIIKLIPKLENSLNVGEFRPISLLNTDLKILSHVLAARLRGPLDKLIRKHQLAYLPKRSIHTAIIRARLAKEKLGKSNCIVAMDFSKAFDRMDREYILELLTAIGCPDIIKSLIAIIYSDTKAFIEIGGYLSRPIKIDNGIKQGCPLSALLFILGIEPLLQAIRRNNSIKSNQPLKVVAYADDINVFVKKSCLSNLLEEVKKFNKVSKLEINIDKTKVLTLGSLPGGYKQVSSLKILGFNLDLGETLKSKTTPLENSLNNSSKVSLKCMTLRARSMNIETFVTSKLLYILRHLDLSKTYLEKLEMKLINCLWLGGKHSVNKRLLYFPAAKGGVGFKNLNLLVAAAKITDMFSVQKSLSDNDEISAFKKSSLFRKFKTFLAKKQCFILEFTKENFKIVQDGKVIDPMTLNSSRLYHILMQTNYNTEFMSDKISSFYSDLGVKEKSLIFKQLTKIWKHKQLTPLDKNVLFLFFLNSYLDKPTKWIKNFVEHPMCYLCQTEFETMQHLFFDCEDSEKFKIKFNFDCLEDILNMENTLGLKYLVAKLISSWCQETSEYLKKLGSIP